MINMELRINNRIERVEVDPERTLLSVLRDELDLTGTKYGCGEGQCGACTVLIDGSAVRSCRTPVRAVAGKQITTIEGLGTPEQPGALQRAFIREQACQCGYCSNGMIVAAQALLLRNPKPSEADVKRALEGHLCRCGAHNRIVRAVMRSSRGAPP